MRYREPLTRSLFSPPPLEGVRLKAPGLARLPGHHLAAVRQQAHVFRFQGRGPVPGPLDQDHSSAAPPSREDDGQSQKARRVLHGDLPPLLPFREAAADLLLGMKLLDVAAILCLPQRHQNVPAVPLLVAVDHGPGRAGVPAQNLPLTPQIILKRDDVVLQELHAQALLEHRLPAPGIDQIQDRIVLEHLVKPLRPGRKQAPREPDEVHDERHPIDGWLTRLERGRVYTPHCLQLTVRYLRSFFNPRPLHSPALDNCGASR